MPERKLSLILEQRPPVIVQATDSVAAAAREMNRLQQNAALVVNEKRTVGIITETDIVRRVIAVDLAPEKTRVDQVMSVNPVAARAENSLGEALYLMHSFGVHHIPVLHQGKAIGMVCVSDALASDLSQFAHDAEFLDHLAEVL